MSKARRARTAHLALTAGIIIVLAVLALRELKVLEVLAVIAGAGAFCFLAADALNWSVIRHDRRPENRAERLLEALYRKPPKEFS